MPQPGQKTITVSKSTFDTAKKLAQEKGKSIARLVTDLIEREKEVSVEVASGG